MSYNITFVSDIVIYTVKMILLAVPFAAISYGLLHGVSLYYTPEHIPSYLEAIQLVVIISILNIVFYRERLKDKLQKSQKRKELIEDV